MFAYFIITFEVAFLYTVFWYIFLREPKPFRVVGDPWGRYDTDANNANQNPALAMQSNRHEWMGVNQSQYYGSPARHQNGSVPKELPTINRNPAIKYGWVAEDDQQPATMPRVLVGFRETLDELRLRMI